LPRPQRIDTIEWAWQPEKETAVDVIMWGAAVCGLAGAVAVYALVRRDLGTLRALLVAAATLVALAIGWLFALYGAVVGAVAAIVLYAVARSRVGAGGAVLVAGVLYFMIVAGFAALIFMSLDSMG
jgi:hypothetical protein